MKKNKLAFTLIQAGLLVVFAGGFLFLTKTQVKPTTVYEFSRDIPSKTVITDGDLVKVAIPSDAVTSSMVQSKKDIVGKALTSDAFKGQYIIEQQLVNKEKIDPFKKMDLTNYRKISIPVKMETAVGGNLKKGDKVDLTFIKKGTAEDKNVSSGNEFTYAKTFLQDVLVYNVVDDGGRRYVDQTEGNELKGDEDSNKPNKSGELKIITLAVTSQQAEEVYARLEAGKIGIVGRFDGSSDNNTKGYTVGNYSKITTGDTDPES